MSVSGHDFAQFLQLQRRGIVTAFNEQGLDGLQDELGELVCMYQRNGTIKAALDTCTSKTTFEGGWGILGTQFQKLKRLCHRFSSVFPGTSTVESDFSVNGWEKMNIKLHSLIFHWKVFSNANSMKCILRY